MLFWFGAAGAFAAFLAYCDEKEKTAVRVVAMTLGVTVAVLCMTALEIKHHWSI